MNYNKWSMICTVQYMYRNLPVNIDELQQVEYDMCRTIYVSYSTCWHWLITTSGVWCVLYNTWILLQLFTLMNYNKWGMICTVKYMDLTPAVYIDEYNKWSMICTVHYMALTPPVNIDELQTSGVWYVLYITWILLHLLTLMNYIKWSMICTVQYLDLTPLVNIDELQQVDNDMYCTLHGSYSTC